MVQVAISKIQVSHAKSEVHYGSHQEATLPNGNFYHNSLRQQFG
jgi:hypothetical protein